MKLFVNINDSAHRPIRSEWTNNRDDANERFFFSRINKMLAIIMTYRCKWTLIYSDSSCLTGTWPEQLNNLTCFTIHTDFLDVFVNLLSTMVVWNEKEEKKCFLIARTRHHRSFWTLWTDVNKIENKIQTAQIVLPEETVY